MPVGQLRWAVAMGYIITIYIGLDASTIQLSNRGPMRLRVCWSTSVLWDFPEAWKRDREQSSKMTFLMFFTTTILILILIGIISSTIGIISISLCTMIRYLQPVLQDHGCCHNHDHDQHHHDRHHHHQHLSQVRSGANQGDLPDVLHGARRHLRHLLPHTLHLLKCGLYFLKFDFICSNVVRISFIFWLYFLEFAQMWPIFVSFLWNSKSWSIIPNRSLCPYFQKIERVWI